MVAEVMWDMMDAVASTHLDGDTDGLDGTVARVWNVVAGYVAGTHADRGRAGLDMVEFLDGWFMTDGMSTCAAMSTLIRDKYNFPYDFAGPAGACP